jgi:hypothetical protein
MEKDMAQQPDMLDAATLFHRIRTWSRSGIGAMTEACMHHQMGGRPGIDPYGWRPARIYAAIATLKLEGSLVECGVIGERCVTQKGIAKYEGQDAAVRMVPTLKSMGIDT